MPGFAHSFDQSQLDIRLRGDFGKTRQVSQPGADIETASNAWADHKHITIWRTTDTLQWKSILMGRPDILTDLEIAYDVYITTLDLDTQLGMLQNVHRRLHGL